MSSFRLFSRLNTFYGLTGQLLEEGYLKFYEAGTTTPADVFGDADLGTNNGSTIALDASGRPDVDIWGDAALGYYAELYASDDTLQGSADNIEVPGGGGATIPTLVDGQFLTNDGSVLLWGTVRQVPDPSGNADKVLSNDGTSLIWIAKPADGAAGVSDTDTTTSSITIGDKLIQCGSSSAPAAGTGGKSTTKSVTFDTAYTSAPLIVKITPTDSTISASGCLVRYAVTAKSTTGFTVKFSTQTGGTSADNFSGSDITSDVAFDWEATGTKTP